MPTSKHMAECPQSNSNMVARRFGLTGLAAAIVLGAVLRVLWVHDIEFKADEAWTFQQTREAVHSGFLTELGMPCSAGFRNPGMSIWVFRLLGKIAGADDPTQLARAVQILNIAAIVLLVIFAWGCVDVEEREPWLWATALASVNPMAIVLQRKIWPPSVLPIFSLAMLAGWWRRERWWGAFAWGLLGVFLGQIHMAGFFFAAGFVAWAILFDRRQVAWGGWWFGGSVGTLPMVGWLGYMLTGPRGSPSIGRWVHLMEFKFWIRWVKDPLGFGLDYVLGDQFEDFLRYPIIDGRPSHFVWFLQTLLALLGVSLFLHAGWHRWQERACRFCLDSGRESPSRFTQNAALWGFGFLLTASGFYIQRHYLVVTFPLEFLWLAHVALAPSGKPARNLRLGRALLLALCFGQLLVSAQFLGYIHVNQGAKNGDYGICYGATEHVSVQRPAAPARGTTGE